MNTFLLNGVVVYPNAIINKNGAVESNGSIDISGRGFEVIELIEGAEIGDLWDGTALTKVTKTVPKVIPQSVTPRQARLALLQATLLDEVELLLANDKAMQIWWEYSLEIERNHTHIMAMGSALGLTSGQLDDLFILAATL